MAIRRERTTRDIMNHIKLSLDTLQAASSVVGYAAVFVAALLSNNKSPSRTSYDKTS
jgi:hypothetical protein